MIGLVLVSHSAKLAEGVRELALQMTGGRVPIAVAGGIDADDPAIGTDPMKVAAAVEAVYSPDGVVILMDLGSALLSAETALEFVEPGWQPHIYLSDAPFVEGAISAAVQASVGSPVEAVLSEARASLATKQQHLAPAAPPPTAAPASAPAEGARSLRLTIPNRLGLHARPAARLVGLVGQYRASVTLQKGAHRAGAHSLNAVALLDVRHGDEVVFHAEGADADAVLSAIQALADDNFGDRDGAAEPPAPQPVAPEMPADILGGVAASRGLAIGPVYLWDDPMPRIETRQVADAAGELRRFEAAVADALDELHALAGRPAGLGDEAAIFEAHALMLRDDDLLRRVRAHIEAERVNAEAAWWAAIEAMAGAYQGSDNDYLRLRAADVFDVGKRVLRRLAPGAAAPLDLQAGSVLAAPDLSPSETAQLDPRKVLAIVTQHGGATSHTAIIARSLGIPAVVGLGAAYTHLRGGQTVVVDGDRGWIHPHPTAEQLETFRQAMADQDDRARRLRRESRLPAVTPDGRRVEVAANIGAPADTAALLDLGAEGVGLFRTELLFMNRPAAPDEAEQIDAYSAAARGLDGAPVIIRTLDIGGDKPIPYLAGAPEDNPFLGYRGIRLWLEAPQLATAQLRAICRVSAEHPVKVMFPMVGTLDEVLEARRRLREVHEALAAEGLAFNPAMEVGIMIEVPSAVLLAAQLAEHVDFFSLGTNDLTQYVMAADRGNARVSHLATAFQPAVIAAIRAVVEAAHAHGRWVGMCGEMAGNPRLTRLLLGLGLDELSMSGLAIPEVKAIIRSTPLADAQAVAAHVLTLRTAAEVQRYLDAQ